MRSIRLMVITTLALLFAGCSTAYKRDWRAFEDATPDDVFTGKWKGHWVSGHNGHTGGLRAIITHEQGAEYKARFHATYAKILQFEHENMFTAQAHDSGGIRFAGENDLGKMAGGVFKYAGSVIGEDFNSTYKAEKDHGEFIMKRVTK